METHKLYLSIVIWLSLFLKIHCSIVISPVNKNIDITGSKGRYTLTMDENNHKFIDSTALFQIGVPDDDCSKISISFDGNTFMHDLNVCTLNSKQSFDYENEKQRTYKIYIYNDSSSDQSIVNMKILNIDDESPTLICPECSLNENTAYDKTTTNCKYTLKDPDGLMSKTSLIIQPSAAKEDDIFKLVLPTDIDDSIYSLELPLYNLIELDYKTVTLYSFSIFAKDSGGNNATQSVIVKVKDIRNTKPTWTKPLIMASFLEKSHQEFDVSAIDGDTGINDPICYYKIKENDPEGHDGNYIKVNESTGHIDVNNIDRDEYDISTYDLSLQACVYKLEKNYCTDQDVSFYVEDIDDNSPLILSNKFSNGSIQEFNKEAKILEISFLENYAGNFNFTSFIEDKDSGVNAEFSVELTKYEDDTNSYDYTIAYTAVPTAGFKSGDFQIVVKNSSFLDYEDETWKNHNFYLKSTGTHNIFKTDEMLVKVSLIDYNDEIPKFNKTEYSASIPETASTGFFVLTAYATDRDADDMVLSMEIIGTYAQSRLSINSDGNIVVDLNNSEGDDFYFDYDILNSVFFQVRATDSAKHTAMVSVSLTIEDVNNKAPTIEPASPVSVEENQKDGIALNVIIKATDPDTTADLRASIDWDNSYATKNSIKLDMTKESNINAMKFLTPKLTPETGGKEISISLIVSDSSGQKPDFETFDSLYLNLVVKDLETDKNFLDKTQTSGIILISIVDINDNTPYFPDSNNENRTVQEGASKGTSVGLITAIDLDIGSNITYDCVADNPDFDWINVEATNGSFTVKENDLIDADKNKTFTFKYACTAFDQVHYSDKFPVQFYIIDTNNKSPVITLKEKITVVEKSPKDTALEDEIGASDEDRDIPFHTVVCRLQLDSSYAECTKRFYIDDKVIKVKNGGTDIDRDHGTTQYSCYLICNDNDLNERSLGMHTTAKSFEIILLDKNDNTPELLTGDVECWESLEKDEEVTEITATDIDEGDNALIEFSIEYITNDVSGKDITKMFYIQKRDDYIVSETVKKVHLMATDNLKGYFGEYTVKLNYKDEGTTPNENSSTIKLTIKKFNFESPVIKNPKDGESVSLFSSQTVGSPLTLFKSTENLEDFTATDGATEDCSKWDVTFKWAYHDDGSDNIFVLKYVQPCVWQLQINNNFDSEKVLNKVFNLEITAWNNNSEVAVQTNEKPYSSSVNILIKFFDNSAQPHFNDVTPVEFSLYEAEVNQKVELNRKATYDFDDNLNVFYYFDGDEDMSSFFEIDLYSGNLLVVKEFYYDDYQQFKFQIVASNDTNPKSSLPDAYLNVTITVISINRRPPQFISNSFFGAVMPTYSSGAIVTTIRATDPDECDKGLLSYAITSDISKFGSGLDVVKEKPFYISTSNDEGQIFLDFTVESTMTGYFKFEVTVTDTDTKDKKGDGPHSVATSTTIFIITSESTVDFKFLNDIKEVQEHESEMLKIVGEAVKYTAYVQNLYSKTEDEQTFAIARLYFMDDKTTKLLTSEEILNIVVNINTFSTLANQLKNLEGLYLRGFTSQNVDVSNNEQVLRHWLIGVSIGLGLLILLLIITIIWRTRVLSQRISKLTTKQFGSQDSGLNRLGVSAPTTNKHAVEGSNPVYKNENKKPKDSNDFDTNSIRSGDSDLVGIENNPEFDYNFNAFNDKSTYL